MSRLSSAILDLKPFFLVVKEQVQRNAERTVMLGLVQGNKDIPDVNGNDCRQLKFILPNTLVSTLGTPWTLLYCHDVQAYMQNTEYGILVNEALVVGTVEAPGGKKLSKVDKLPFNEASIEDRKIAVWQVSPKN